MRSAIGLLCVALASPAPAGSSIAPRGSSDGVLLLGLKTTAGLSTYLVDAKGIRPAGDGIAVPRNDGWWKLVVLSRKSGNNSETAVWIYPAAHPAQPPAIEGCGLEDDTSSDEYDASSEQSLLFVGPSYFSVEQSDSGYCGGAHGYASVGLATLRIVAPPGRGRAVDVDAVFGKEGGEALDRAGSTAYGGPEGREAQCLDDPSRSQWGLIRSQGAWVVRGALGYSAEPCRGNHAYFTVPIRPPASLTGSAQLPRPWTTYVAAHPGLTDVVVAPRGAWTLFVDKAGLELDASGHSLARAQAPGATIVMTQWAFGKNAEVWRAEVPTVLAAHAEGR